MDVKLYVGNLSQDTSEDALTSLFSESGSVVSVTLIKDYSTGISKGFAFIEMSSQVEAEQAVKDIHGKRVDGRQLKVKLARPLDDRTSRGYKPQSSNRKSKDKHRRQGDSRSYYD